MKKLSLTALVIVLAGCNATDDKQAENIAQKSSGSGAICRQEKEIGTNMRRTVCRTKAQIEQEKKETELAQKEIRRQVGGDINQALRDGRQ